MTYKLTYFDGRGLNEPIRLLFAYGNIKYEDIRLDRDDWEKNLKAKSPYGQLPTLETPEGIIVNQSLAIARYLAKKVGLNGKTDLEDLQIDAIVDTINDMRLSLYPLHLEKEPTKKKALGAEAKKTIIPFYLAKYDEAIKKNKGYIALPKLTWADIHLVGILPLLNVFLAEDIDLISAYPNLKTLVDKIEKIPQIKKWIETRPDNTW